VRNLDFKCKGKRDGVGNRVTWSDLCFKITILPSLRNMGLSGSREPSWATVLV
jgi:hypothetical protein